MSIDTAIPSLGVVLGLKEFLSPAGVDGEVEVVDVVGVADLEKVIEAITIGREGGWEEGGAVAFL